MKLMTLALAGALALAGCESTGYGYGQAPTHQTHLSQCARNALIGAGVGALLGAAQHSQHQRTENAALGAALGGAATYAVCSYLTAREQQRVENAYYQSLTTNAPVQDNWQSDQGQPRSLHVAPPAPAAGGCRSVTATLADPQNGAQQLPPETFCRDASGAWRPS